MTRRLPLSCALVWIALLFALFTHGPGALRGGDGFAVVESEEAIEIRRGEALVLRYHKLPPPEAAEHPPALARGGYIHPLVTPGGRVVTDDLSPRHPHQHGLFFAWTKTEFEGRDPEFWDEMAGKGRIRYLRTVELIEDEAGASAGFEVEHRFEDLTAPDGPQPVLAEHWRVQVRMEGEAYLVDFESRQRSLGEGALRILQYHYGGMAVRGNAQWLDGDEDLIRTSEGHGRLAGNHTRPEWVEMAGTVDGAECGLRMTPDPGNFRHPQWVRLHQVLPYFVFSPMVEEPFEIGPDEEYVSRFRIEVFDGPSR